MYYTLISKKIQVLSGTCTSVCACVYVCLIEKIGGTYVGYQTQYSQLAQSWRFLSEHHAWEEKML